VTQALYRPPWRVDLTIRAGVARLLSQAALVRLIAAALEAAGAPRPASVGLILGDDAELAGLNATHMGLAGPTDVLSFPLLRPEAYPSHEGRPVRGGEGPAIGAFALPPGARPHLGDVVVSVERAIDQAERGRAGQTGDLRPSPADELRLLVTHGVLHLCGWDHAEPIEEAAMRRLERELLERCRPDGRPLEP